jgi:hypothetical protein
VLVLVLVEFGDECICVLLRAGSSVRENHMNTSELRSPA